MELETYFDHDSDDQIIQKRSENELAHWLSHVNFITYEGDRMAKIASNVLNNTQLRDAFLNTIEESILVTKTLNAYKKAMPNYKECDHLECDMFYINQHEEVRRDYLKLIATYRELKDVFYAQFLN